MGFERPPLTFPVAFSGDFYFVLEKNWRIWRDRIGWWFKRERERERKMGVVN